MAERSTVGHKTHLNKTAQDKLPAQQRERVAANQRRIEWMRAHRPRGAGDWGSLRSSTQAA